MNLVYVYVITQTVIMKFTSSGTTVTWSNYVTPTYNFTIVRNGTNCTGVFRDVSVLSVL